jgi:hypothetical protein
MSQPPPNGPTTEIGVRLKGEVAIRQVSWVKDLLTAPAGHLFWRVVLCSAAVVVGTAVPIGAVVFAQIAWSVAKG